MSKSIIEFLLNEEANVPASQFAQAPIGGRLYSVDGGIKLGGSPTEGFKQPNSPVSGPGQNIGSGEKQKPLEKPNKSSLTGTSQHRYTKSFPKNIV